MKAPSTPKNEIARLGALTEYDVLDSPAEQAFDDLTRLAANALGVPIALVSIVDSNRQWFKSRYGTDARETPRDVSFCGHIVADEAALIVTDASKDPRFSDNPLVTGEPHIGFYAGAPLRTPEGFVLGTLCAIDHVPREMTDGQRELLRLLAGQAMALLELRRKERLFHESEGRLRAVFDAMDEGVVVQAQPGAITSCNPAAERILGLSLDQMLGRESVDLSWRSVHEDGSPYPGEDHPAMVSLRTGEPLTNAIMGVHRASGELRWLSANSRPLFRSKETSPYGVVTTFRDVTEQRARAAKLALRDRFVTTGTMAAGLCHEINNPLSYILANTDFAIEELRTFDGGVARFQHVIEALSEAKEGTERVRKLVRGLRSIAREGTVLVPTDLRACVEMAVDVSMHELKRTATVIIDADRAPPVLADEASLTQVFVNLLVNASQSFRSADPRSNTVKIQIGQARDLRAFVSVTDNGPGILAENLGRIFDPFFTTKPPGSGTGLGLSVSLSIVAGFGGELGCETEVGRGTTFRVSLPAYDEVSETVPPSLRPSSRRGRVLVVDDDPSILRSVVRLLGADHDVTTESDPRSAASRIEAGESFDIIFSDLEMPHMTGAELYERLRGVDAAIADRVVFFSGSEGTDELRRFLADVPNERIEKPANTQNLRGIVRRFVESSTPRPKG